MELKEDGRDDMEKEGKSILDKIGGKDYVISLDLKGEMLSSEKMSQKIDELALKGISNLTFVIGGSNGLSEVVLQRSNHRLFKDDVHTSDDKDDFAGANLQGI